MLRRKITHKRKQRGKFVIPLIIVAIMVFSAIAFAMFSQFDSGAVEIVNGVKFVRSGNLWDFKFEKITLESYYNPNELSDINVSTADNLRYQEYILTSDPNATNITEEVYAIEQAKFELKEQMEQKLGVPVSLAYTEEYEKQPIINCKDSTSFIAVIRFSYKNITRIEQTGNCVKVEAKDATDMIRARDLLFFKILGFV